MEHKVIEETDHFYIAVGKLPKDKLEEYLVINKQHGVIEYNNPVWYFAKEWVRQMEEAISNIGKEPSFPPPSHPNGQFN